MKTLDAFDKQFPTEAACRQYLMDKRWPNGQVMCPRCGEKERIYVVKARPFTWVCKNNDPKKDCGGRNGYRFSVLTGTIFQDTKKPLKIWFKVGYLMLVAKKGISALQVHRVIFGEDSGSDYRTSWYMCMRWRAAMRGDAFPLTGIVEIDETYVGGHGFNRHRSKQREFKIKNARHPFGGKIGVIGAIARKGNVVAQVIEHMDDATTREFVQKTVHEDVELVATDEKQIYKHMDWEGRPHKSVYHRGGEYVRGIVHTANLDQFWSLLKRGVMGQFHHVSQKYMPLYLNEFSFRHNNRKNPDTFAELMTTCSS